MSRPRKPREFKQIMAQARERSANVAAATDLSGPALVAFCAESLSKIFGDVWPQIADWLIDETYAGSKIATRVALRGSLPTDDAARWSAVLMAFAEVVAAQVEQRRRN